METTQMSINRGVMISKPRNIKQLFKNDVCLHTLKTMGK